LRDGKQTDNQTLAVLLDKMGVNAFDMARVYLQNELRQGTSAVSNPAIRKTAVTATTIQSSKGLSGDYVFITHFDDQYFIKDDDKSKMTDQDICNFLVALTRTKRKVFLISSNKTQKPAFFNWIDKKHIQILPSP
jgi:superfamily I DNA/RNA helicase